MTILRGRFITFEGGEGAGKSTQARRLAGRLAAHGIETLVTREPGGSPGAEAIRHVLLSGGAAALGPDVEAALFAAARDDHLQMKILPALDRGIWVICDRFADSTRVYQGIGGQVAAQLVEGLEALTVGTNRPDLTLVLDLPPKVGLARVAARQAGHADRFERETLSFHQALRQGFRDLVAREPSRCVLVDASVEPDKVERAIWAIVEQRLDVNRPSAPWAHDERA